MLVAVGVAENDAGKGGTTEARSCVNERETRTHAHRRDAPTSIVYDLLHNPADVAIALREVESTELGRRLVVVDVRLELQVRNCTAKSRLNCRTGTRDVRWHGNASVPG